MTGQTPSTTNSMDLETKPNQLDLSSIGLAFVRHIIKLKRTDDDASASFEEFMLKVIFPAVDTRAPDDKDVAPDQHFLLSGGTDRNVYVWMIRLEYPIHQTPLPVWLDNRARKGYASVKDKIDQMGTQVSTELLFDVKEWRQLVGFKQN